MSVRGYAIKANGEIDVRTVSTTEKGAKINWLFHTAGSAMAWLETEEEVVAAFTKHAERGATCIRVNIEECA